jgi:hypothetical protein
VQNRYVKPGCVKPAVPTKYPNPLVEKRDITILACILVLSQPDLVSVAKTANPRPRLERISFVALPLARRPKKPKVEDFEIWPQHSPRLEKLEKFGPSHTKYQNPKLESAYTKDV